MIERAPPSAHASAQDKHAPASMPAPAPKPNARGFGALLDNDLARSAPETNAARFSETGVLGRQTQGAPRPTLHGAHAPTPALRDGALAPTQAHTEPSLGWRQEDAALLPQRQSAQNRRSPQAPRSSADLNEMSGADAAAPAISPASTPAAEADGPDATELRAMRAARVSTSAILVAVHATDHGLKVFARVGRMTRTDKARLRQSIRALLAEHGVSDAEIEIIAMAGEGNAHG